MDNVLLSFIVPVYNTQPYLTKCIESILMQEVKDCEIIIVNDGSTDNSLDICLEYQKKSVNIKIINKSNEGISSARNDGLNEASGKYVCFLDSDDYYKEMFANRFLEICEKHSLDIIRGLYSIYDDETSSFIKHGKPAVSFYNKPLTGQAFLERSIKEHCNEVVPWLGFFKREYLIKNDIDFPKGIVYEEDQLFFFKSLLTKEDCKAYQSDLEFYAYRKRKGSATKTPTLKQARDVIYIVTKEMEYLNSLEIPMHIKKVGYRYICSSFYQLTSIYGRVAREHKKIIAKETPYRMKKQCLKYPYDRHQFIKIFLFTYFRLFVDFVYKLKEQ